MAAKSKGNKPGSLSSLGKKAEAVLEQLLVDMANDVKDHKDGLNRRYSLTDQMRVIDRVNKLEAIKAKLDDDEGTFFDRDDGDGDDGDDDGDKRGAE